MINRKRLKCVSCGTRVITRTGIGHATVQKHKFACPTCEVEIGFILDLGQETPSIAYREPTNAVWDDGEDAGDQEMLFYPEVMIPRTLESRISPFIATVGNFKDIENYQKEESTRRHFKNKFWQVIQKAYVHFETGNLELLKKEIETMLPSLPDVSNSENRGGWILSLSRRFFDFFIVDPKLAEVVERKVAYAVHAAEPEVRKLATEYVKSGRMLALWKEVKSVRKQFLSLYESLQSMLMVRRYWKYDHQNVEAYELSVKNFEDLKGFYIDCVETTFRLLVIGLGVELIETTGQPRIKTKTGYSGEGERSFRRQAERHSGDGEQQSERSDADVLIVEQSVRNRQARLSAAKRRSFAGDLGCRGKGRAPLSPAYLCRSTAHFFIAKA